MAAIKRTLIIAAVILCSLALLLGILVIIANTINWNKHNERIAAIIEKASGWDVKSVSGIRLEINRSVHLSIDQINLNVQPASSVIEQAQLRGLNITISLKSILEPGLIFEEVQLEGLNATLRLREFIKDLSLQKLDNLVRFIRFAVFRRVSIGQSQIELRGRNDDINIRLKAFKAVHSKEDRIVSLDGHGNLEKMPFHIAGDVRSTPDSPDLQFLKLRIGKSNKYIEVEGSIPKDLDLTRIHFHSYVDNPRDLGQALNFHWGKLPTLNMNTDVNYSTGRLKFENIILLLGQTKFLGEALIEAKGQNHTVEMDIRSPHIRFADVRGFIPIGEDSKAGKRLLPDRPLPLEYLHQADGNIRFRGEKLSGKSGLTLIKDIDAQVTMQAGSIQIDPIKFSLSEGLVGGRLSLNTRQSHVAMDFGMRGVQLQGLLKLFTKDLPVFEKRAGELIKGRLAGHIDLETHGKSLHQLAAHLGGKTQFAIEDGQLAKAASEAFGFQLGEAIAALFKKRSFAELDCMVSSFAAREGVFRSRAFIFSTEDVNVYGEGYIDLGKEFANLTFESEPKNLTLGVEPKPITIYGPLKQLKIELSKEATTEEEDQSKNLLSAIADMLPFVEPGQGEEGVCHRYLGDLRTVLEESQKSLKRTEKSSVGR